MVGDELWFRFPPWSGPSFLRYRAATRRLAQPPRNVTSKTPLFFLLLAACVPPGAGEGEIDTTQRDIQHYEELAEELEEDREQFLGEAADELRAIGNRVFWLQFPQFAPDLYSWAPGEAEPRRYDFSIGGDAYNYSASEQLVVTAEAQGQELVYRAYAVAESNALLGELTIDGPSDEQRWWAYAADGANVYIAVTGENTKILQWRPGSEAQELLVLEDLGVEVGELWDIFAYRGRLLVIESGRLWLVDPGNQTASFMQNQQEVRSVSINKNGVAYPADGGPRYLSFAGGPPIDVGQRIEDSGYELNQTFSSAHRYLSHPVLFEEEILYVSQSGIFSLDIPTGEVQPLLLEPRDPDLRLVYRDPQVLEDGTVFLQGLASESGAIGADGPIYQLKNALN